MNGKTIRLIIAAVVLVVGGFALYDALRVPDDGPYRKIPHGDHVHYMPKDRNPDAHLDDFPTKLPPQGFVIDRDGNVVKAD